MCCSPQFAHALVKSAILVNLNTGRILYERNPNKPVAPASLTKIMTMCLAMDAIKAKKLSYNSKVRISRQAAGTGGSAMHLRAGESVPVVRLLAGAAVASGNDAATALAEKTGGNIKNFVRMMNRKAAKLGMRKTLFKNPTGLPAAGQKTTARDLVALCRAYLREHPDAARFHKMIWFMHKGAATRNTNPLLGRIKGVNGLKTGWTVASGYNLIVTAQKGKTKILAIVLGASSKQARDSLAIRLVEAGYKYPASPSKARAYVDGR